MKSILALNIRHGGGTRMAKILTAIEEQDPCTVVLTEFRNNGNASEALAALGMYGYTCIHPSNLSPLKNSVAIFSKFPMDTLPHQNDATRERLVGVKLGGINLIGAYFPAVGQEILQFFPHFRAHLNPHLSGPTIVLGDFNSGVNGLDNESGKFSASVQMDELSKGSLIDAWRFKNGSAKEYSWYSSAGNGFRIDHCLVTKDLIERVSEIRYLHSIRESKISDHSGLLVTLT